MPASPMGDDFLKGAYDDAKAKEARFAAKVDLALAALTKAKEQYCSMHPDSRSSRVHKANAAILALALPPIFDVLNFLSDDGADYGCGESLFEYIGALEDTDDITAAIGTFLKTGHRVLLEDEMEALRS